MARPRGSRTKLSGAGLKDLEMPAKKALRKALEEGTIAEANQAAGIVCKYIYIPGVNVIHSGLTADAIKWDTVTREQRQMILSGADPKSVLNASQLIN